MASHLYSTDLLREAFADLVIDELTSFEADVQEGRATADAPISWGSSHAAPAKHSGSTIPTAVVGPHHGAAPLYSSQLMSDETTPICPVAEASSPTS